MNRLAKTLDRPRPTLAVVMTGVESDELIEEVASIKAVAEFRADLAPSQEAEFLIDRLKRLGEMPVMLTLRTRPEGGDWKGTFRKRRTLFSQLMPFTDGVDVETLSLVAPQIASDAHKQGKVVIGSRHSRTGMPSPKEMEVGLSRAKYIGADYAKFAVTTQDATDFLQLRDFTVMHSDDNVITVDMGEFGITARSTLTNLGSRLTYAHNGLGEVAPGQVDFRTMHDILKLSNPDYARRFQ